VRCKKQAVIEPVLIFFSTTFLWKLHACSFSKISLGVHLLEARVKSLIFGRRNLLLGGSIAPQAARLD
jgi:hypothetical protein